MSTNDDLPDEIYIHILSYLDIFSLAKLSSTSKFWSKLSCLTLLENGLCVPQDASSNLTVLPDEDILMLFRHTQQPVKRVDLRDLPLSADFFNRFVSCLEQKQNVEYLEELRLDVKMIPDIAQQRLSNIVKHLRILELRGNIDINWVIENCDGDRLEQLLIPQGDFKIKSFDKMFPRLTVLHHRCLIFFKQFPNLTEINIDYLQYKEIYPQTLKTFRAKFGSQSCQNLPKDLESLEIYDNIINNEIFLFTKLQNCFIKTEIPGQILENLPRLKKAHLFTNEIPSLSRSLPKIQEIHIQGFTQKENVSFCDFMEYLPNVKKAKFTNNVISAPIEMSIIHRNLRIIEFNQCRINNSIIIPFIISTPHLKQFSALNSFFYGETNSHDSKTFRDRSISSLSIEVLKLSRSRDLDEFMEHLSEIGLLKLKDLYIDNTQETYSDSIRKLISSAPNLQILNADSSAFYLSDYIRHVKKNHQLRELDITFTNTRDDCINQALDNIQNFQSLQSLKMMSMNSIRSMDKMIEFALSLPRLRILSIGLGMKTLHDSVLERIGAALPKLEVIMISSHNSNVSDACTEHFVLHQCTQLRILSANVALIHQNEKENLDRKCKKINCDRIPPTILSRPHNDEIDRNTNSQCALL
eukprot:gb/GECH01004452.1/.p1 GENE.gb/GECH01004452.1/~~gb/GECH01004452.1/.p1  ORF type:complete len:639 (+),score=111.60 gb/GECH01004452.1/:1-1917(+)